MDKLSGAVQPSCSFLLGGEEQAPATFRRGYGHVSPCSDKRTTLTLTDPYGWDSARAHESQAHRALLTDAMTPIWCLAFQTDLCGY